MNNNNADISLPNYTDIHPILSDIESFLSSMRDLSVSVDGFDTEGLDLDGLDSDVPGIKNNIKAVLSDDSEINETYESLKRIADLLQINYMSSIEQIIEENEYLKPYLDLLMNLNGDDFFAIYQDFDKLLSDYNIELKDLEKQIDQEKYSSITYVNVNGVNLPVQTSSVTSSKLKSLEDERNELIQAMYIVKQLKDLNLNSAYNTCMQNDDYNINSTTKIASYKTVYHEGEGWDYDGVNYGGWYSVAFYDKDGNEINPSYIDQAIYFYQSGEPSYLMPLHALDKEVSDYYQNMSYLLPNELGIMEYLSNTGDVDKLNTYISLKMDEASSRHGQQLANNMTQKIDGFYENNDDATAYALTLAYLSGNGLVDGLKTFATGIYNLFDADANVSPDQYKTMYLMQYLKEKYDENKIAEIVSTGSYEISNSIGNMIPSIGLNLLVPGSGLAALGLSAAGNARKQGLQQGMSEGAAWVYGILSGTSEALLEKYLGGIPGLSNLERFAEFGGIKGFLAKMVSEGIEESTQAILEPLFATIVTNGKIPFEVDWREVAKSGIYGMITAGIMNGGEGVIKMTVGGISYNIASTEVNGLIEEFKGQDLTDPKVQEELKQRLSGMEEANKLSELNITEEQATELIERSNTENVNVSEELKNIRAENIKSAQDAKAQKLAEDKLAEEARSDAKKKMFEGKASSKDFVESAFDAVTENQAMKENFERIASEDGWLINPNIAKLFTFKRKPEKSSELTDVNLDDDLTWEDEIVDDGEDEILEPISSFTEYRDSKVLNYNSLVTALESQDYELFIYNLDSSFSQLTDNQQKKIIEQIIASSKRGSFIRSLGNHYIGYNVPETIASNYEAMSSLIENEPNLIEQCKVTDPKQYLELLDKALANGYNVLNLNKTDLPNTITENYTFMNMLIERNSSLIKQCKVSDSTLYLKLWKKAVNTILEQNALNNRHKYEGQIERFADWLGVNKQEVEAVLARKLHEFVNNGQFGKMDNIDILELILDSGYIKNQFETGTSNGGLNPELRLQEEYHLFGIPDLLEYSDRPIYGMVYPDPTSPGAFQYYTQGPGSRYGSLGSYDLSQRCVIIWKKDVVLPLSSLTCGDSLNYSHNLVGTPASNPTFTGGFESMLSGYNNLQDLEAADLTRMFNDGYDHFLEVQVYSTEAHSTNAIDTVVFFAEPSEELKTKLANSGIEWVVMKETQ